MMNFAKLLLESYSRLHEATDTRAYDAVFKAGQIAKSANQPQPLSPLQGGGNDATVGFGENGIYIEGGPFGSRKRNLKELGKDQKGMAALLNWYTGAEEPPEEGGDQGDGTQEPEQVVDPLEGLSQKERKRVMDQLEAVEELNSLSPGMGDAILLQYESQKLLIEKEGETKYGNEMDRKKYTKQAIERLQGDYFSNKNSSIRSKLKSANERETLFLEKSEQSDDKPVTLFEREPVTSTQSKQSLDKISDITKTLSRLRSGTLNNEEKRSLLQELRLNTEFLQRNEDGTIFMRVDESTPAGISFNTSPQHSLSKLFDAYDEEVKKFQQENIDLLDEGEELTLQNFEVQTDGGNMGEIVKNVSEDLELATHHIVSGNTKKAGEIIRDIATRYKDSIYKALRLQRGMGDQHTEQMRVMLKDMGITGDSSKDEVVQTMTDILSGHVTRRMDFYKKYNPEFVSRVGGGSVAKGDKADNLLVWTSPPKEKTSARLAQKVKFQDLDKDTKKAILDGGGDPNSDYYVVGLSLKTYQGGIRTKAGESYNLIGVGDRYSPSSTLSDHERFVLNEFRNAGLSERQIGDARKQINEMSKISSFTKQFVENADQLQIIGKTPEQSTKAVINHIELMMKQNGIKYPVKDINYFDKLKGADGLVDEKSRKDFLKKFASHLEKELMFKHMRGRTKNGKLRDDTLHALLIMGADAGLDSVRPVLGGSTKLSTNESHTYVQNEELMRASREIIQGKRDYALTNQGLVADGRFTVNLERRGHGLQVNMFLSSMAEDLNLV